MGAPLTALYDAIHAVALTTTGATSLMHEAKVDVVTVPNLSEHLSNAATTAQLSLRFALSKAGLPASVNPMTLQTRRGCCSSSSFASAPD